MTQTYQSMMIRVLFLNRRFEQGGAERQLIELLKGLDKSLFRVTVITFYGAGPLWQDVNAIPDIEVIALNKKGRWDILSPLWKLWRVVHQIRPDIIHGYLDYPNILSLLLGRIYRSKVVWGIRNSARDWSQHSWPLRVGYRVQRWLSRFPDLIICNSRAGKDFLITQGFPNSKMIVIHNGIDANRFHPNQALGQPLRAAWDVSSDEILIGMVARLSPVKDYPTFLQAAAQLVKADSNVRFVCVGKGSEAALQELQSLANDLGIQDRIIWAGAHSDMVSVYNALDIFTLTSISEGFANVVGEAMACGVPCVVTDVGDNAVIVGDTGIVVSARDPGALVAGWQKLLDADTVTIGTLTRERITTQFSTPALAEKTGNVLKELVQ